MDIQIPKWSFFSYNRIYDQAKSHISVLSAYEVEPDKFNMPAVHQTMMAAHQFEIRAKALLEDKSLIGRIRWVFMSVLAFFKLVYSKEKIKGALNDLTQCVEGMAYSRELRQKVDKDKVDIQLIDALKSSVVAFKQSQPEVYEPSQHTITDHDLSQIRKIARYDHFAKICLANKGLATELFKATIRNFYPVSCFIQYPHMHSKLHRAHISPLVGAYHGVKLLKRDKENHSLLLRFDYLNQYVDIMREHTIKVTDDLTVPLTTIYDDFQAQEKNPGEYSMLRTGIAKWSIMNSWKKYVNENSPLNWYESLPEGVADVVTFAELKRVFHDFDFEEGDWIVSFATTRQAVERDIINSHGFNRIYIPAGGGVYKVFSPGVYAEKWPQGYMEFVPFIGDTVDATWTLPDPNHLNLPHRSKAEIPTIIKKDNQAAITDFQTRWKRTLLDQTLTFQWSGDNCAVPAEKLARNVPKADLVLIGVEEVKIPPLLCIWVKPYVWAPRFIKAGVLKLILLSLGGNRTRHGKNLFSSNMSRGKFNYPGLLHELIRDKKVKGIISGGHNRDNEVLCPV